MLREYGVAHWFGRLQCRMPVTRYGVKTSFSRIESPVIFVGGSPLSNSDEDITINVPLFKKLWDIIFFSGQSLYEPFQGTF